jgi:hypothetical protein
MDPSVAGWLVPAAFTILGPLMVVLGIRMVVRNRHRQRAWIRYPGEAFDYVWHRGNQYWMLRWIDRDGVQRTAQNPYGNSGGTVRSFPFPVEVLVDPQDPRSAQVATGANSGSLFNVLIIAIGLIFGLVGGAVLMSTLAATG